MSSDHVERLRQAAQALREMRQRLDAAENAARKRPDSLREPIAIVGLACRFPAGANTPGACHQALLDQVDGVREIPEKRWDVEAFYDPDPEVPGKMYCRAGGFMADADLFDPFFFGLSPREAERLDPQQRLLLEVSWEALESAGRAGGELAAGSGVFVGISSPDYGSRTLYSGDPEAIGPFTGTGMMASLAAGRVAHVFGLEGPVLALDTACSSSLVAVHLAVASLRRGECTLALAGGVNVISAPESMIYSCTAKALSPDGRSRSFDAAANGYGRGEGCGMVALRRLRDAVADGDRVLAVIHGSAVGHDGRSAGITVPRRAAQVRVLRAALADAGVEPGAIDYVEAHGTGTPLGDPIEAHALAEVFAPDRPVERPLAIGSIKTNFGHMESAAGIAGLIKLVLALEHGEIPPQLHFNAWNPHIDVGEARPESPVQGSWTARGSNPEGASAFCEPTRTPERDFPAGPLGALSILTATRCWPASGSRQRLAGVSSFGFSGTNAHVVVGDAPPAPVVKARAPVAKATAPVAKATAPVAKATAPVEEATAGDSGRQIYLLTISSPRRATLHELTGHCRDHLQVSKETLSDLAFSANAGRRHFDHRLAVVGDDRDGLLAALDAFAANPETAERARGGRRFPFCIADTSPAEEPRVAFLFAGQGAEYPGMGRELARAHPIFRRALERCGEILQPKIGRIDDLLDADAEYADPEHPAKTAFIQPALVAFEIALAELWRAWGIVPSVVVGHSVGEIAAAHVAGVLSLEDALTLAAERGHLFQTLPTGGAMATLFAAPEQVEAALPSDGGEVVIAAHNAPRNVTISGPAPVVKAIVTRLAEGGLRGEMLEVSHAFHSPAVEPILAELDAVAATLSHHAPHVPLLSTTTGEVVTDVPDPSYWRRQAREPVLFSRAIKHPALLGCTAALEIGPNTTLCALGAQTLDRPLAWLPSLRRGRAEQRQIFESLATLYVRGARIHWREASGASKPRRVDWPVSPMSRQRYPIEGPETPSETRETQTTRELPVTPAATSTLLGTRLSTAGSEILFQTHLAASAPAYLRHHQLHGMVVVPATAYLEMALAAAVELQQGTDGQGIRVGDVIFAEPLTLPASAEPRTVQMVLRPAPEQSAPEQSTPEQTTFEIFSLRQDADIADTWIRHAWGKLAAAPGKPRIARPEVLRERCPQTLDPASLYQRLRLRGLELGEDFRAVRELRTGDGESFARLELGEVAATGRHLLHPALLDAGLQTLGPSLKDPGEGFTYVPVAVESLDVYPPFTETTDGGGIRQLWCHAVFHREASDEMPSGDLFLFTPGGRLLAALSGLCVRKVSHETVARAVGKEPEAGLYGIEWKHLGPVSEVAVGPPTSRWWILGDDHGVGEVLTELLRQGGAEVHLSNAENLDPDLPEDVERLLAHVQINGPLTGIVHLGGIDDTTQDGEEPTRVERRLGGVLRLVQALGRDATSARLWLVTAGAHSVAADEPGQPGAAALWGLARAIAAEHPELGGLLVDLDPAALADPTAAANNVLEELTAAGDENRVVHRGGARHAARLVHQPWPKAAGLSIDADATYWITGGTGGLGLELAGRLIGRGARTLVLTGRRPPTEQVQAWAKAPERQGARVHLWPADVSDPSAVAALCRRIGEELGPLRGVIHAAGVLDDGVLLNQQPERFRRVLDPKVRGAWNLHQQLQAPELHFFVLFSSVSGILDAPGQGSYAAANNFLDALAAHRRALGLPALSIAWGPWAGGGMAPAETTRRAPGALQLLSPEAAWEAFERLLAAGRDIPPRVVVARVDLRQLATTPAGRGLFLSSLDLPTDKSTKPRNLPPSATRAATDATSWLQLAPAERRRRLLALIATEAGQVLRLDSAEALDPQRPLNDYGLDSLSAIELRNALVAELGIQLQNTVIFDHPTPGQLSAHLERVLLAKADAPGMSRSSEVIEEQEATEQHGVTEQQGVSEKQEVSQLSGTELERSLLAELKDAGY